MRARATTSLLLALAALALAGSQASAQTKPLGVDVSRFQGTIDWPTVAGDGIGFAFVQASRGNGYDCTVKSTSCGADAYYAANYANAKAAGVRVGAYHRAFATGSSRAGARADAITEADLFVSQVAAAGGIQPGDLLPVLDVETPFTGLTAGRLRTWVKTWLVRVRKRLGQRPMIYTNATSWRATGDSRAFARAGHQLWVAHWGVSSPSVPAANWRGRGWSVWQVTSSGSVAGISGRVDLNRLRFGLGRISVR